MGGCLGMALGLLGGLHRGFVGAWSEYAIVMFVCDWVRESVASHRR